jgi:hypothetical protein
LLFAVFFSGGGGCAAGGLCAASRVDATFRGADSLGRVGGICYV